ncbi:MarR family transcriptional regulator, transcriptional regulator for hemolysin [Stenotrophomonas lactitubi]|nr:MarR family transcriptional regulator, transcriptional regulator for hemolysin [Stenotrophomonas sp. yr243]SNT66721.1 MarR family transcriptional regulator, transcriptional regulator for hemolysin [Stenotrophomonas lactitubi]
MKLVVSYLLLMDRPLDERTVLQMQLSSGLLYAGRQWQRLADSRLGSYGISTACTMPLLMIGRSGGGIRQVALAQQLGMEGPSLVRLLDKLCASGLVRRECDASDRRANLLWLTEEGQALVRELEDQLIGLRQDVFGELSTDELHAVLKAWRLLAEAADRIT